MPDGINLTTELSIALWTNGKSAGGFSRIVGIMDCELKRSSQQITWNPDVGSGGDILTYNFEGTGFRHLVITQSVTTAKLYIDGVLKATQTVIGVNTVQNTVPQQVRTAYNSREGVDEVRLYVGELNQTEINALYDEGEPTPNPATFSSAPASLAGADDSITMTASEGSGPGGAVQYRFVNTTNSNTSGWQGSRTWIDTGLTVGVEYTYYCQIRDATYLNETAVSSVASATVADDKAPTPNPAQFLTPPTALDDDRILMSSEVGSDEGTVEYRFEAQDGGNTREWNTSPFYIDSGLDPDTTYNYTVQMRDDVPNTGTASAPQGATTDALPSTGAVLIHHWKLDEPTGGAFAEDSVGGANLTTQTPNLNKTESVPAPVDTGFRNTDGSKFMLIPVAIPLVDDNDVSISFWYRSSRSDLDMGLFSLRQGSSRYEIGLDDNINVLIKDAAAATVELSSGDDQADNRWHNLVLVITDSVGIKLYIDKVLVASDPDNTMLAAKNQIGIMGNYDVSETRYIGDMDDVRIYSGILTTDEIDDLYDNGNIEWELNDNYNGYNDDYAVDRAGREANDKYGNSDAPEDERLNNVYGKNNTVYE
jgi:hypothetical protein